MTPFMFAQDPVSATAGTVGSLLSGRSDAMVILVLSLMVFGFWLWKIHLPRQESERVLRMADKVIHETNALTLAELGKVAAGVHVTTTDSRQMQRVMVEVKHIEFDMFAKVAKAANCDIGEELAEAKGVLRGAVCQHTE